MAGSGTVTTTDGRPTDGFAVDASRLPLLFVVFPKRATAEDIDAHMARLLRLFQEHGPYALVADIDAIDPRAATPVLRTRFAEGVDHLAARGAFLAEAVVASSALVRGVFTAYSWFRQRKPYPISCFATRAEALVWSRQIIEQRKRHGS